MNHKNEFIRTLSLSCVMLRQEIIWARKDSDRIMVEIESLPVGSEEWKKKVMEFVESERKLDGLLKRMEEAERAC